MTDTTSFHIIFLDNQMILKAPTKNTQKLQLIDLQKATLNWNFNPQNGGKFGYITFNGQQLSADTHGSRDVTNLVVINGDNTVVFDFYENLLTWTGLDNGIASVSLDVVAGSAGQQAPTTTFDFSNLPWWVWVIIALIVLVIIYVVLKKTGIIGDAQKAVEKIIALAPLAAV